MNQSELRTGRSPLPPADYLAETKQLYNSYGYDSYRWAERPDQPLGVLTCSGPTLSGLCSSDLAPPG